MNHSDNTRPSPHRLIRPPRKFIAPTPAGHGFRSARQERLIAEALARDTVPDAVAALLPKTRLPGPCIRMNPEHIDQALQRSTLTLEMRDSGRHTTVADLERLVGRQRYVATTTEDRCFWAPLFDSRGKRHRLPSGQTQYRRFVHDREMPETALVTLVLDISAETFQVVTAYYGLPSGMIPGTSGATEVDASWWWEPKTKKGHAFVVDEETAKRIVWEQKTDRCPW